MDNSEPVEISDSGEDNDHEGRCRMFASISFIVVVLVIGIPMWWKTTEVYRVSLPYADIYESSDSPIRITLAVGIYTPDPQRSESLIKELTQAFAGEDPWIIKFRQIVYVADTEKCKTPFALEAAILKNYSMRPGDFLFLEWTKLDQDVLLTTDRSAIISPETTSAKLRDVLNVYILRTDRIKTLLIPDEEERRKFVKTSPPTLHYQVVVSGLNTQPSLMRIKWDLPLAAKTYVKPFLDEIADVANFTLKTQWKYQFALESKLKQVRDSSKRGRHYALKKSSLPHIITAIEKHLGTSISEDSVINFAVLIPPCDISPIHIYDGSEMIGKNNVDSFMSPKWGGVIIYNPPEEACLENEELGRQTTVHVNTNEVMQILLFQLYKLLDMHVDATLADVKLMDVEQVTPRKWEYEQFIRRTVVNRLITSTRTLQSLIQLLDEISYIVISDEVGEAINMSYENILAAKELLLAGDLLGAMDNAKRAFLLSEKAFFDSSLLAQLYFPDEQKYAIYIPLFLPIMVPVVGSLSIFKRYYQLLKRGSKIKIE